MKTFTFNVYWQMCGTVSVEADSEASARAKVAGVPLPAGEYLSDSFEVGELNETLSAD